MKVATRVIQVHVSYEVDCQEYFILAYLTLCSILKYTHREQIGTISNVLKARYQSRNIHI